MKTKSTHSQRPRGLVLIVLALVLLSGCREEHVVWSPDGQHAVVMAQDGLHLSDAAGHLTPSLVPEVRHVAWLGDSTRLVLVRSHEFKDWATGTKLLGPVRTAALAAAAEAAWKEVVAGATWEAVLKKAPGETNEFYKVYLRERHGAELQARLTDQEWKNVGEQTLVASELVMARLEGEKIVVVATLHDRMGELALDDIRLSPDGRAVAFTAQMMPESGNTELMLALLDASMPAVKVAGPFVLAPDWTADSRGLVSVEAPVPANEEKGNTDGLTLGALVQRRVFDDTGHFAITQEPHYLAGVLVTGNTRVRCLRDGRILFNSAELTLPLAMGDYGDQRDQLFALDPARQSTLVRLIPRKYLADLPGDLGGFEVSPDEKRVLFGGNKGDVCVLTLASGEVEVVQRAGKDDMQTAPAWRSADEFTYEKRSSSSGDKRPVEIVRRRGEEETVLSAGWSDDFMKLLK